MLITPGQRNDIVEAEALIIGYDSEHVIGDKGYDSNDFIDVIDHVTKELRRTFYKERHLVECFFNKLDAP